MKLNLQSLIFGLFALILVSCGPESHPGHQPGDTHSEVDALQSGNAETDQLRLAYCELLQLLYGKSARCVDGGRVILDDKKSQTAGIIFDGDYGKDDGRVRYLLCLRDPGKDANGMASADGMIAEQDQGKWKVRAIKKNLVQLPLLDMLRVVRGESKPTIKLGYRDADGQRTAVFVEFQENEIVMKDSFVSPDLPPVMPCLGLKAGASLGKFRAEPSDEKDLLKTAFERLVASRFSLEKEEFFSETVDSTSRNYVLGNSEVQVGTLIFSDGEIHRMALSGVECEGEVEGLLALLKNLYPELEPFDLQANSLFTVVLDYEDFRVTRAKGKVTGFFYESFYQGRQRRIALRTTASGYTLEVRAYYL